MISGIQDVHYNAQDVKRAVAFYRDILGMKVLYEDQFWATLQIDSLQIGLRWTGGGAVPPLARDAHGMTQAGATLTLKSQNLDDDEKSLRFKGVQITKRVDAEWGHFILFEDPDGNLLKLMQPA